MRYLLGLDIGSSSVKAALIDATGGETIATAVSPETELEISSPQPGFAEQDPEIWWTHACAAVEKIRGSVAGGLEDVAAIGIAYQMHGLVLVDKDQKVLRPAIIWCDSRAVEIGQNAFRDLGETFCLSHFLNSPGNFTASKLRWVKEHEPEVFARVHKAMLPGDYIAMRLSGDICTTPSGLSEGVFWDFTSEGLALPLLEHYGIDPALLAPARATFSTQGEVSAAAASQLGLRAGTPISYRAGDQPNNAFSLNVLSPGEVAATAGTSGVIYGVSSSIKPDARSRVNTFLHVNHSSSNPRYGTLLCVNGTGILNSWLKKFSGTGSRGASHVSLRKRRGALAWQPRTGRFTSWALAHSPRRGACLSRSAGRHRLCAQLRPRDHGRDGHRDKAHTGGSCQHVFESRFCRDACRLHGRGHRTL